MLRVSTTSATGAATHSHRCHTHTHTDTRVTVDLTQTKPGMEFNHHTNTHRETHTHKKTQVHKLTTKEQQAQLQPPAISHRRLVPCRRCQLWKPKTRSNTCTAHMRCTQRQLTQLKVCASEVAGSIPRICLAPGSDPALLPHPRAALGSVNSGS